MTIDRAPAWMADANCRGVDPDDFFPARGDNKTARRAKAVCAGCTVRAECLDYALELGTNYGIFGGESVRERRRIARQRKKEPA